MIERKIVIGLITSTEYLQKVKPIWNIQLIESPTAKRLAEWCWVYFAKYGKCPGNDIEAIYYKKIKDPKFPQSIAEEIGDEILPGLSEESVEDPLNVDYLVEETKQHFLDRHLAAHTETLEALRAAGRLEEAAKLAREYKPLEIVSDDLTPFILSAQQIRRKKIPVPKTLIKPWLKEGQGTIIYGAAGTGKSLLAISIAYVLGLHDFTKDEAEIAEWKVMRQASVLYIDGELGELEMDDRIRKMEWLGKQPPQYRIKVFAIPEYQFATEDQFYLSERKNQIKVIQWLKANPTCKVVVLDSVSTCFGLEDENSNSEWNNKVNPFLRDLRAMGIAYLLLHHSGKDLKRGLRGASSMGAMVHNIFKLISHPDKDPDDGEAWFILSKDKQRSGGKSFRTFAMRFFQNEDEAETHWEITKMNSKSNTKTKLKT